MTLVAASATISSVFSQGSIASDMLSNSQVRGDFTRMGKGDYLPVLTITVIAVVIAVVVILILKRKKK